MWHAILHPLSSGGASFYGGIGGDIGEIAVPLAIITFLMRRTCHVNGCWRTLCHIDPELGHPACRRHSSCTEKLGVCPGDEPE